MNTHSSIHSSIEVTALAVFVRQRLESLGLRQSEFCRRYDFDQGMLSRIQNSSLTRLSLESVLRLACGLRVSPQQILQLIGRSDLHELIVQAYTQAATSPASSSNEALFLSRNAQCRSAEQ